MGGRLWICIRIRPEHTGQELMRALSIRIRNWCACSACAPEIKWCLAPPKIKIISLYFSHKVTFPEKALWCNNYENPSDRKSHTWAPLKRIKKDSKQLIFEGWRAMDWLQNKEKIRLCKNLQKRQNEKQICETEPSYLGVIEVYWNNK